MKEARVKHHPHLRLIPPVGYLDFLWLLDRSRLVLTDSGGIQEEVGQDPTKIVNAAREVLGGTAKEGEVPRLWDGQAAEQIVEILCERCRGTPKSMEPRQRLCELSGSNSCSANRTG